MGGGRGGVAVTHGVCCQGSVCVCRDVCVFVLGLHSGSPLLVCSPALVVAVAMVVCNRVRKGQYRARVLGLASELWYKMLTGLVDREKGTAYSHPERSTGCESEAYTPLAAGGHRRSASLRNGRQPEPPLLAATDASGGYRCKSGFQPECGDRRGPGDSLGVVRPSSFWLAVPTVLCAHLQLEARLY